MIHATLTIAGAAFVLLGLDYFIGFCVTLISFAILTRTGA